MSIEHDIELLNSLRDFSLLKLQHAKSELEAKLQAVHKASLWISGSDYAISADDVGDLAFEMSRTLSDLGLSGLSACTEEISNVYCRNAYLSDSVRGMLDITANDRVTFKESKNIHEEAMSSSKLSYLFDDMTTEARIDIGTLIVEDGEIL